MKNLHLVGQMRAEMKRSILLISPLPCPDIELARLSRWFVQRFKIPLPEAYREIMRRCNGLKHNGLMIWPARKESKFGQTLVEANEDLRDFNDRFVYFANLDNDLYVFDSATAKFCAIEYDSDTPWQTFQDANEMFDSLLERAWAPQQ